MKDVPVNFSTLTQHWTDVYYGLFCFLFANVQIKAERDA